MGATFTSDFFKGNRERLKQLFTGTAPIVMVGNGLLQRGGDENYPFKQDSSFWYLTGVDDPEVVLVMDKGSEYLIVPTRDSVVEAFDGAIDREKLAKKSGIKDVLAEKEGWKQLEARLKRVQHVATLAANPPYIERFGLYTNPARARLIKHIKDVNDKVELLDLRQHLARMRAVKQPVELEALQEAIDITIDTLKEVTRPAVRGKYAFEYEIEADITRGFRRRGADGHAFGPIVASGERACTLHYVANNGPLSSDELVVMDIGAAVQGYSADLARTMALSSPSRRQQQVHEAVVQAQAHAFSLLKPGAKLRDYEKDMEAYVGEKLRELGLIKSISSEDVRRFFPHATSHYLGLDTHDAGDYDHPLEVGTVLAVEPGIYIPAEGIGVRIEDNVVITEDGIEILSQRLDNSL